MSLTPKCLTNFPQYFISILTFFVFLIFDFFEVVFCVIFRYLDEYIEGDTPLCCCRNRGISEEKEKHDEDGHVSETLYARHNLFRQTLGLMGFLPIKSKSTDSDTKCQRVIKMNRWSDCGCDSCLSWANDADAKLHLVVNHPSIAMDDGDCKGNPSENVIFLHGFISSSSFWTETVFPNISEQVKQKHRLIAVDLLGFGRSPKPRDCSYSLKDHVGMIEKSVIHPLKLRSFHLVAHSMGCIIALALAAKYPNSVKSITLVAPPYFPYEVNEASVNALTKIAAKKLWPPQAFVTSFMSWYEHLGRLVCLVVCRNHKIWEKMICFITRKRDVHFLKVDVFRHTHQSGWSSMHNVICGGAKFMDGYLEVLRKSGVRINVIQGDKDAVVPLLECCFKLKLKAPEAEISIIRNADHSSVVLGREKELARHLEDTWASCS